MTNYELAQFLFKKSKIKPLEEILPSRNRYSVRKLNSLHRIANIFNKHIRDKYSKYDHIVEVHNYKNRHYWIDLWSKDNLLTIQFDKK